VKRANRRRIFDCFLSVPRDGVHAIEDLFGNAARITTELKQKVIAIKRTVNTEIKKMGDKTLFEQIMISNPRGNTHRTMAKLKEFARHRCMLREVRIAGKQIACRANDRKSKRAKGSKGSINLGATSGIFTSVQGLIKLKEVPKVGKPKLSNFRVVNARNEIMSTYGSILNSVEVLEHKVEITKDDTVSTSTNSLTYELKDLNLLSSIRRIQVDSKNIEATKLRITPKVEGTRINIQRAATKRGTRTQKSFLNGKQAASRVMVEMS